MARCENCNKFTGLNFEDPEIDQEPDLDGLSASAVVRLVRTSECCGDELKEATLELETEIPEDSVAGHYDAEEGEPLDGHGLEITAADPEPLEEGGGRYAKRYFGAQIAFTIDCACGATGLYVGTMGSRVAASEMDEC